jgi:hypothetical protein
MLPQAKTVFEQVAAQIIKEKEYICPCASNQTAN